jgi:hypothetical protein
MLVVGVYKRKEEKQNKREREKYVSIRIDMKIM